MRRWRGIVVIAQANRAAQIDDRDHAPAQIEHAAHLRMRAGHVRQRRHLQHFLHLEDVDAKYLTRAEPEQQQRQRSEEHTSELQSLMRISYAVFCLKKKNQQNKSTS